MRPRVTTEYLHRILHRFKDIADYWSNFRSLHGVPLFDALVRDEI